MSLPIAQSNGVYTNPCIDNALTDVTKYLRGNGLLVTGNIDRSLPAFHLGPYTDVYHVPKDVCYTVVLQRSLGAFRYTIGDRDDGPQNRSGPDTLRVVVASSDHDKSRSLLEEIVRSVQNVEAFATVTASK